MSTTAATTTTEASRAQIAGATKVLHDADASMAAARIERRQAERDLRAALSDEPWFTALVKVAVARRRSDVIAAGEAEAHAILQTPTSERRMRPSQIVPSIAAWSNGVPSPDFLIRPLIAAVDEVADAEIEAAKQAHVESVRAGDTAAAVEWLDAHEAAASSTPTAAVTRKPGTVEVFTQTHKDGRVLTTHRNVSTGESVTVDESGQPYTPPPVPPVPMGGPSPFR